MLVPRLSWSKGPPEDDVAKCQLTGKSYMTGNLVSHSNKKAKTQRQANIRTKRVFDPETGRYVRIKVSARALRTLSRKGWDAFKNS